MNRQSKIVVSVAICLVVMCGAASADSMSWNLTESNSQPQVPCTLAAPCATVTLDVSGNNATLTVTSLLNGYIFDTFGFNTVSGVSVSLVSASGEVGMYSLGGVGNEDGFGSFKYNFDTGKNGGSSGPDCQNQGPGCTFKIFLTSASTLTLADFEVLSSGGAGSGFFAGHLAAINGNTGYVGGTQGTSIPEPTGLAVLFPTLLTGMGLLTRRALALSR